MKALQRGFKPAHAETPPGQTRLRMMPLVCRVTASPLALIRPPLRSGCAGLWFKNKHSVLRDMLCFFNPRSFPNLVWSEATGLVQLASARAATKGTLQLGATAASRARHEAVQDRGQSSPSKPSSSPSEVTRSLGPCAVVPETPL